MLGAMYTDQVDYTDEIHISLEKHNSRALTQEYINKLNIPITVQ